MALTQPEQRVKAALIKWKIDFEEQVPLYGGRVLAGGFVVDFVVYNPMPIPTPIEVFGEYWHQGALAVGDKLKLAMLQDYYGIEPVVIWGNEVETQDDANKIVYQKVYRG